MDTVTASQFPLMGNADSARRRPCFDFSAFSHPIWGLNNSLRHAQTLTASTRATATLRRKQPLDASVIPSSSVAPTHAVVRVCGSVCKVHLNGFVIPISSHLVRFDGWGGVKHCSLYSIERSSRHVNLFMCSSTSSWQHLEKKSLRTDKNSLFDF